MSQQAALAQHEENKQTMNAIDGGLDTLVGMTGQIKQNAGAIGTELSEQIDIMKDTNARMDVTDQKINAATTMVDKTTEKVGGSQLCQWICMVVLVLAIIVFAVVPIKFPDLRP
jgi:t-SNARE complex subunit (syntaxin)